MAKYDTYVDSQTPYVGEIPSHWKMVQNKRVMHKEKRICESYNGQNIISLTLNGAIVRDLGAGGKMPTTFDGYQYVYPGELLMCLFDIDVTPRCVGRVNNEGLTSPAYSSFVLHDNANLGYYYYYYLMLDHTKELLHLAKNLRHSLTEEQIGQIKVPLPSISEQKAISEYLDKKIEHIDSIIAEAKASIEEYKAWKSSIIYEAVTKGLDPNVEMKDSGVEWIGKIPADWGIKSFKRIVLARDGGAWGDEPSMQDEKKNKICLRIADFDFDDGRFKRHDIELYTKRKYSYDQIERLTLQKGDLLVEKSGGGEKTPVGRLVMFDLEINAVYANFMDRIRVNSSVALPEYVAYYWKAMYYKTVTTAYIKQTTGIQNLNLSALLEKEYVLIPEITVQENIIKHLDAECKKIDQVISEKNMLVADLEAYKKSLIFEVVTGKRKVV